MLAVRTDHPHPLAEFRRLGIAARLARVGDHNSEPDPENLRRCQLWDGSRDGAAVAPLAGLWAAKCAEIASGLVPPPLPPLLGHALFEEKKSRSANRMSCRRPSDA